MTQQANAREVCDEIAGEVRDIASWLAGGRLTPKQFSEAVLTLEDAKVKRFGFTLTAVNYPDGRTHFALRFADTGETCANLDYDPATGELQIRHRCEENGSPAAE